MTNYTNWNYQDMGFKSETEMKESIARVERQMKMDRAQLKAEKRAKARDSFDERGGIDFDSLNEGARKERLDRQVHSRITDEQEQAKRQARQEEMQELFSALGDSIKEDNRSKAEKEFKHEKEKMESDLQKKIYSKHNVDTDKEERLNEGYRKMLKDI